MRGDHDARGRGGERQLLGELGGGERGNGSERGRGGRGRRPRAPTLLRHLRAIWSSRLGSARRAPRPARPPSPQSASAPWQHAPPAWRPRGGAPSWRWGGWRRRGWWPLEREKGLGGGWRVRSVARWFQHRHSRSAAAPALQVWRARSRVLPPAFRKRPGAGRSAAGARGGHAAPGPHGAARRWRRQRVWPVPRRDAASGADATPPFTAPAAMAADHAKTGDCRMYEAKYPEVDDVVMVMVREREGETERRRGAVVSFLFLARVSAPTPLNPNPPPPLRSTTSPRWARTCPSSSTRARRA